MKVEINGSTVELGDGASARDAAVAAGVEPGGRGIAIALDGEVVPRARLDQTLLSEGQRVEVVRAIGGGAR